MSAYNFAIDKKIGDVAEDAVLKILHDNGFLKAFRVPGKEVRWDIIIPEIDKKIEVKNDLMAEKTNNLAIEIYKQSGEASGIMASQSDFWIIFAAGEIYMLDRVKLREYCINNATSHRIVMGGDRMATQMMLVPIAEIKKQKFFGRLG